MPRAMLAPALALMIALLAPGARADPAATLPATTTGNAPAAETPARAVTSSITGSESRNKKLQDCMAIWEPRTHMTKAQWRRTCTTELEPLPTP